MQKHIDRTVRNLNKNKGNYLEVTSKNLDSVEFLRNI